MSWVVGRMETGEAGCTYRPRVGHCLAALFTVGNPRRAADAGLGRGLALDWRIGSVIVWRCDSEQIAEGLRELAWDVARLGLEDLMWVDRAWTGRRDREGAVW